MRNKGTLVRNLSSSVFNRTSPSLLHTFVVDTLLNFPMQFNIILTYTIITRVNAFRRLLVFILKEKKLNQSITVNINEQPIDQVKNAKILGVCIDEQLSWKHHFNVI